MKIDTTTVQDLDDEITPYRQGYLDYMLGQELHQNPYKAYGDEEIDHMSYYLYFDGWVQAQKDYPRLSENFE